MIVTRYALFRVDDDGDFNEDEPDLIVDLPSDASGLSGDVLETFLGNIDQMSALVRSVHRAERGITVQSSEHDVDDDEVGADEPVFEE